MVKNELIVVTVLNQHHHYMLTFFNARHNACHPMIPIDLLLAMDKCDADS